MDTYARAFASFVAATDEKSVLAEALTSEVHRRGARSLCDVGAGPGDLAQHLAASVETYVAVESRPHHAAALRALGLCVVELQWPTPLRQQFDAVVLSHVLDPRQDLDGMLGAAVDVLTPTGMLLVVVHVVEASEWERLLMRIGMARGLPDDLPDAVQFALQRRGLSVRRSELATTVCTPTAGELIEALSFVASGDDPQVADEFAARIGTSGLIDGYRLDGHYAFPFAHLLLVAHSCE